MQQSHLLQTPSGNHAGGRPKRCSAVLSRPSLSRVLWHQSPWAPVVVESITWAVVETSRVLAGDAERARAQARIERRRSEVLRTAARHLREGRDALLGKQTNGQPGGVVGAPED